MSEEMIEPCPFCGGTEISKTDNGHEEWLQCAKCGAGGPWIEPPEDHEFTGNELVDQWNKRSAYNPNERLREALEAIANWRKDSAEYTDRMDLPRRKMDEAQVIHIENEARRALSALSPLPQGED